MVLIMEAAVQVEDVEGSYLDFPGTLPSMCPAQEMVQREQLRDLAMFERPHENPAKSSPDLAIKKVSCTLFLPFHLVLRSRQTSLIQCRRDGSLLILIYILPVQSKKCESPKLMYIATLLV
ncbi:hypothetical protein SAY87_027814 [Trapa incisa]|uniref:Uncharacterized protein n=1 Tax=Trapa incisa TaxID=236973 RepID=A0AAN7PR80_9MYRT|nr:hypothetical protein SAY87_027814 [Trapa incisa]